MCRFSKLFSSLSKKGAYDFLSWKFKVFSRYFQGQIQKFQGQSTRTQVNNFDKNITRTTKNDYVIFRPWRNLWIKYRNNFSGRREVERHFVKLGCTARCTQLPPSFPTIPQQCHVVLFWNSFRQTCPSSVKQTYCSFVWLTKGMFAWNCFKTKLRDTAVELLETREGAEYIVLYILD